MATAGKASLSDNVRDSIVSRIREDELVTTCCEVINIPSPTGGELAMAEYMRAAFKKLGLKITWQEVEDSRANVVGRLEGASHHRCNAEGVEESARHANAVGDLRALRRRKLVVGARVRIETAEARS